MTERVWELTRRVRWCFFDLTGVLGIFFVSRKDPGPPFTQERQRPKGRVTHVRPDGRRIRSWRRLRPLECDRRSCAASPRRTPTEACPREQGQEVGQEPGLRALPVDAEGQPPRVAARRSPLPEGGEGGRGGALSRRSLRSLAGQRSEERSRVNSCLIDAPC